VVVFSYVLSDRCYVVMEELVYWCRGEGAGKTPGVDVSHGWYRIVGW
jgi:hypothetical protein